MWFILVFLCAFRTANPLIGRRNLEHLPELDVDSVLNSPEDVESLVDLQDSGLSPFGDDDDDTQVGDYAPDDDFDDLDEDADKIVGGDKLLEQAEEKVKDSVGQPLEVIKKFGHGKYDGPDRPGKPHDGERHNEERGEPKTNDTPDDDTDDGDNEESDDDLPPNKVFVQSTIVVPEHRGPSPQETIPASSSDEEKGRGEPVTKHPSTSTKMIESGSDSDNGAAEMVKSQSSHSTLVSPKVAEIVHKGSTQDSSHKTYKILKPLKIPYSELPEHIRPANWMKGYQLVPKEKPMEKPDYNKLNFETPVTTHPATPNRVIDVDARNPAFYTRPPTAAPPPRPVVHTILHTYKVEPSDTLREMLEHPPELPELPTTTTTQKPRGILPKKFLRYLKSMAESRQSEFKDALTKSNANSRRLFVKLVEKIIGVSEQGIKSQKSKYSDMENTMEKLEDNMDKRFDEFKNEEKTKYAGKLKKSRAKLKKMADEQAALQKQFRDAVVDVKQEVSDDISRARKAHEQESKAGRLERTHLRFEIKRLKDQQGKLKANNKKVVDDEGKLLRKLNTLRHGKGKGPLVEQGDIQPLTMDIHMSHHTGGPPKYKCGSCQNNRCRSACNRCNSCRTDKCRNVCRCGRNYRKNLRRLKRELDMLKRTWGRRNRMQQQRLIRILREKLRRFRMRFLAALNKGRKKKKPKKKKPKHGHKFRTLLFGSWAKRSHRRLYRMLEKPRVSTKAKRKVVRIFHKYYHRAMKEASGWQDSDARLSKYLSTVTKVWMKKARWVLRKSRKVKKVKKKPKKKKEKPKKPPKATKPVKIPKKEPLPPRPPPRERRSDTDKPYAERLYTEWRARSEQFIDVHYDAIPQERRAEVMGYVHRVFSLVRKKYIAYLARNYSPGTRYTRRKRFLDWLVKVSEAVHGYVMKAILGKRFSTGIKNGYLDSIWMKWEKKSREFVAKGMATIHCKEKAQDYINDIFKDAKQGKRNHEAMGSTKATKMKFLKYLVKTSKGLRAKVSFFQKTCKPVKGPRPYVTKMYERWKRLSGEFVEKNKKRLCKDEYRSLVSVHWKKQKINAEKQYLRFLKKEVTTMDQISVSSEDRSDDEEAVGQSMKEQLETSDSWFIQHLKKETRSLESFVRRFLRKCGFTIIPRQSERAKTSIKKIQAKYKKKMDRLDKKNPETMIAKDKTYGITLGFGNRGDANNIGVGVENMKKDRNGNYQYTPWDFNKDADFKRSSYNVGMSFDQD